MERYLSIDETAQRLNTTKKAIRARIARRQLPFRRLGGRILIPEQELEDFFKALPGCAKEDALIAAGEATR